jgi:hypothetical protein
MTRKLTGRKHVHAPPGQNLAPTGLNPCPHGVSQRWSAHWLFLENSADDTSVAGIQRITSFHEAARQALAAQRHEEDDQMEHSQYRHFLSRAREGVDAWVVPARGRDHVGCLLDQVKLIRALNKELDHAMKDIHQFGNREAEAS